MHIRYETVARWERGTQKPSNLAVITLRRVLLVPAVRDALTDELRKWALEATAEAEAAVA